MFIIIVLYTEFVFRKYWMYHLPYLEISGHLARMHLALAPGSKTSIQGASFCEETPADSPWLMSSFNHVFHFTPLNTVQSVHWYPDSDWLRDNWFSAQPFKMQIEQEYQNFDNWDAELSNEQLALNLNDAATLWSLTVTYWQWQS